MDLVVNALSRHIEAVYHASPERSDTGHKLSDGAKLIASVSKVNQAMIGGYAYSANAIVWLILARKYPDIAQAILDGFDGPLCEKLHQEVEAIRVVCQDLGILGEAR